MKKTIILIFTLLIAVTSQAQTNCSPTLPDSCAQVILNARIKAALDSVFRIKDSIYNKKFRVNDSIWIATGIIYPTYSNGVNTWHLSNDNGHQLVGIKDSIVVSGWDLLLFPKKYANNVLYCGVVADEAMQCAGSSMSGTPEAYVNGGYIAGARVYNDYMMIRMSRPMRLQATFEFDSLANSFSIGRPLPNAFNFNSPNPLSVTWGQDANGELKVTVSTAGIFKADGYVIIQTRAFDLNSKYLFMPIPIGGDRETSIIKFVDKNFSYVKGPTPPNHLQWLMDFGTFYGKVDLEHEPFPVGSNFFVYAVFKD